MFEECPEITFLLRTWVNGGSALPAVRMMMEHGYAFEAACTANVAMKMLASPPTGDGEAPLDIASERTALQSVIARAASASDGWIAALEEFAHDPSEERWDELMRFVPEEVFYQRLRFTTMTLLALGCDGNILFKCATKSGMTSDTFDLATSGRVDPETIEARAAGSPTRVAWLGLAAQAAFARSDRWNTLRYLREAVQDDDWAFLAWASISEIRRNADPELLAEMEKLGIPEV